jgi:hypothetical protein
MGAKRVGTLPENQVIYHRGGSQSFDAVFNPLRTSAHSAVESNGTVISLEKSTLPRFAKKGFEWSG